MVTMKRGYKQVIQTDDFGKIEKRYEAYWAKENHDRPLLDVRARRWDYREKMPEYKGTLRERWLDTDYVIRRERAMLEATYFAGEAYPLMNPNLGPDVFGSYFGCGITFGEDTSWASRHVGNLEEIHCSWLDRTNFWLKKTIELTEAMLEKSKGDYLVGITDIHPGMDGLVSLRGPEELCFDLYEETELVKQLSWQLFERFTEVYELLNGILIKKQKGNSNWMGIYHSKGWYVTSCDFMGMISSEMYKTFVEPELKAEIAYLGNTMFHLDGPGALRHLDALLTLDGLDGIQWVYGAGQPTAAYWIPVLQKIQGAGKMIHVDIIPGDLPVLLENLKPEGVMYRVECASVEEADAVMKMAGRGGR